MAPALKVPKAEDFGGPKKPATGFFRFMSEIRDKVTAELREAEKNGGEKFSVGAVTKAGGAMWEKKDDAFKKTYEDKYHAEKAVYEQKLAAWKQTAQYKEFTALKGKAAGDKEARKAKRDAKDSGMPKKYNSLYMFITSNDECQAYIVKEVEKAKKAGQAVGMGERAKFGKEFFTEAVEDAGKKAEWEAKWEASKVQYEKDMEVWLASEAGMAYTSSMAGAKAKKQGKDAAIADAKAKLEEAGMPKKPNNAYFAFLDGMRVEAKQILTAQDKSFSAGNISSICKPKWDALGEAGQKKYKDEADALKAAYDRDIVQWKKDNKELWKAFEDAKKGAKRAPAMRKRKAKGESAEEETGEGLEGEDDEEPDAKRAKVDDSDAADSEE